VPLLRGPLARQAYSLAEYYPSAGPVECLRALRTGLALDYCRSDAGLPVPCAPLLMICSADAQEGKSFISVNLATVFARPSKRVLLIDGDLYKRSLSAVYGATDGPGLADLCRGPVRLADVVRPTQVPGLSVLPVGARVTNPEAVLDSPAFEQLLADARRHFDLVIIDSPPVLATSTVMLLAKKCDACVMIVRSRVTRMAQVERAMEAMQRAQAKECVYVVNGINERDAEAFGYGSAYYSGYSEIKAAG
jgi:capsular exopolysaccharide synthesis family protein